MGAKHSGSAKHEFVTKDVADDWKWWQI